VESSAHYLTENLRHQLSLHRELIALCAKKRRAIGERDVVGLEAILCREEGVIASIRRLKESTAAILEKFAERFHISPDDAIMDVIADSMEEDVRQGFCATLHELTLTAREIASHDALRAHLVKHPVGVPLPSAKVASSAPVRSVPPATKTKRRRRVLTRQPA
jgi:hypothetical protein